MRGKGSGAERERRGEEEKRRGKRRGRCNEKKMNQKHKDWKEEVKLLLQIV